MKPLLNTLFVATQGAYLRKEGESIVVSVEKEEKLRVPIHNLSGVLCFGNVLCSPFLLGHCAANGVTVSFLTENGRFLARASGSVGGNVLLRREQYRRADDRHATAAIARSFVLAKVANSRAVLQRAIRDHGGDGAVAGMSHAVEQLKHVMAHIEAETDLDVLRGYEGDAGRVYFGVFDGMITSQRDHFRFSGRTRRPPLDPVNALLSFVYTLLVHDCVGALEAVGLDPQVGYLHRDRPGRPGLALDLMEEFRAAVADRLVLSLLNLRQLQPGDFVTSASGAVGMKDAPRKTVLCEWQKRKQERVTHPFLGEAMPIGQLPYAQALLLARYLRGDVNRYPPYFLK